MPSCKLVPSLSRLCLPSVRLSVAVAALNLAHCRTLQPQKNKEQEEFSQYIKSKFPARLTNSFIHEVMTTVMSMEDAISEASHKRDFCVRDVFDILLGVFLHHGLSKLYLCHCSHQLQSGDPCLQLSPPMSWLFFRHIEHLTGTTVLELSHCVDDVLVMTIAQHLPQLQHLSLGCKTEETYLNECLVQKNTKDSIKDPKCFLAFCGGEENGITWQGCPHIQSLCILNPDIFLKPETIPFVFTRLLEDLPILQVLTGIPMITVANQFSKGNQDRNKSRSLPLTNFHHIDAFDRKHEPDLSILKRCFTNVETVELVTADDTTTQNVIHCFPRMKNLRLYYPKFNDIMQNFEKLQRLDVTLSYQSVWPLFIGLNQSSNSLQELLIRNCAFDKTDIKTEVSAIDENMEIERYSEEESFARSHQLAFKNLILVEIHHPNFIESDAFLEVISACPKLRKLKVILHENRNIQLDEFSDDLFHRCLPFFRSLECLHVEPPYRLDYDGLPNCPLTKRTLHKIVEHCPCLRHLLRVELWDVTEVELHEMNQKVIQNNWNIVIV
ncbi:uncharacterized protein LOC143020101 [Oratosquilla oratoria]|uniref:uncharacterized protein LOC143020101 n=1 Tax=Oratosquilla oratoria TaxID=337810 RepID=UPI003F7584D8